jgi:hypothetical protein
LIIFHSKPCARPWVQSSILENRTKKGKVIKINHELPSAMGENPLPSFLLAVAIIVLSTFCESDACKMIYHIALDYDRI